MSRHEPRVYRIPGRPDEPYDDATLALWQQRIRDLVSEGRSDAEIDDALLEVWSNSAQRQQLTMYRAALRATGQPIARPADPPTDYAREMIPKVRDAYRFLARSTKGIPSRAATAKRAEVDRDTLADWIGRGWMTWPPE